MFQLPARSSLAAATLAVAALTPALLASPAAAALTPTVPTTQCERAWTVREGLVNVPIADALGYAFETTGIPSYALEDDDEPRPTGYGALSEGFTAAADDEEWGSLGLPVHGTESWDAFDDWGQLFVGGMGGAHQYSSEDAQGCQLGSDGRSVRYEQRTIHGLKVQRTISIGDTALGGARFLDTLTNPTGAPITTEVNVGDLVSLDSHGSLGSDSATRVAASSSGDGSVSAADTWFVTTDGEPDRADPAIAFVTGSKAGARDRVATAVVGAETPGAGSGDPGTVDRDQVGYGWKNVTIAPGETATFASYTLLRTAPSTDAADNAPLAAAAATALQELPLAQVFAGMTREQITGVRNWPLPAPAGVTLSVSGDAKQGKPLVFTAAVGDPAEGVEVCAATTTVWEFPDGTTETGASVTRALPAGAATVKATTVNACGGRTSGELALTVAALPPAQPAPAPAPAAPPFVANPPKAIGRSALLKGGLKLGTTTTQPGRLRVVLEGKGIKVVKMETFKRPVTNRKVKVSFTRKHRAALRRLKKLRLITTFTAADGTVTRTARDLRLK